jgi:hypothetical protein
LYTCNKFLHHERKPREKACNHQSPTYNEGSLQFTRGFKMTIDEKRKKLCRWRAQAFLNQEGDLYDYFWYGIVGYENMTEKEVNEDYYEIFGEDE